MCGGIDDGYSEGSEPIFFGFDPGIGDESSKIIVIGGSQRGNIHKAIKNMQNDMIWIEEADEIDETAFDLIGQVLLIKPPELYDIVPMLKESNPKRCNYSTRIKRKL